MTVATSWRTQLDRRPAPPPPSGLPDQLDTSARQVRLDDVTGHDQVVHRLRQRGFHPRNGVQYLTVCDQVLAKVDGAMLTTRETDCGRCRGGGRRG